MSSLERILPFLSPIRDLLMDPEITEVMVNAGGRRVFVERGGTVEPVPGRTVDENSSPSRSKTLRARAVMKSLKRSTDSGRASEDGSRVAAMFPPCSVGGPTLTIRRSTQRYSLDDLVAVGSVPVTLRGCSGAPSRAARTC